MKSYSAFTRTLALIAIAAIAMVELRPALAAEHGLEQDARAALKSLYESTPSAKALGEKAKGILVFPNIVKAGFIVGGQGGDGVMLQKGKVAGYYNSAAASVGLQAGAQSFGYAVFFMTDSSLNQIQKASGWEVGLAPGIVIVDAGTAKNVSTTTTQPNIYAFIFDQKGLMAGAGMQGMKITKISK